MKHLRILSLSLALFLTAPALLRAADGTAPNFGTATRTESALIGILYDFKQNQKRETIPMEGRQFLESVAQFLDSDWDEGVLNKYYRVSRPLYTTELVFDRFNADFAPKAFGVDKTVKPRLWMAYYKGQVVVPADGTYRFVGFADNFLAVAVNSKTVLVACLSSSIIPCKWSPPADGGSSLAKGTSGLWGRRDECVGGDWINLKAGQVIDIDIIFGEVPGGESSCFLGIQKKGEPLPPGDRGLLRPHPFQLARSSYSLPNTQIWKGLQ